MSRNETRGEKNARKMGHSFADRAIPAKPTIMRDHVPSPEIAQPDPDSDPIEISFFRKGAQEALPPPIQFRPDPEFETLWGNVTIDEEGHWEEQIEKQSRQRLTRDLLYGFSMQRNHFGNPEDPENGETTEVVDACTTILGRVLNSRKQLTNMFPTEKLEEITQSQLLEVIRRITLNPSYFMFGITHDKILNAFPFPGNDFNKRMNALHKYRLFLKNTGLTDNDFSKRAFIHTTVKNHTDEDWNNILRLQESLVFSYVRSLAKRFASISRATSQIAPRLVEYGDAVYTEEQLELFRRKAENADQVSAVVLQMQSFSDLFPQIRKWFGQDASFKEFLDKLDRPIVTARGAFEVPLPDFFD